jgi:hypothetical protein
MKNFKQDQNGMFICEECLANGIERTFKTLKGFAKHITYSHQNKKKEYYDKYLFEDGDNICKNEE